MNLRNLILRGTLSTFALTLFASLQAQTITFTADNWPGEVSSCIVTFSGDTILNVDGATLFPNGAGDVNNYSIGAYGAGDYTVYIDDIYGDGGTSMAVDAAPFNCTGDCSGTVTGAGSTFAFTLTSDVPGCTDSSALNYDDTATLDDGTCLFDTCPDADQTMVFVNMTDSWGDGWNGNTYSVYADDVLIATGSLDASATGTGGAGGGLNAGQDTICIPVGACYEVVSGGGSFLSEIGWTMVNVYTGD